MGGTKKNSSRNFSLDLGQPRSLFFFGKKAGADGICGKPAQFIAGKALFCMGQEVLIGKIGAEEGGIVGVEDVLEPEVGGATERMGGKGRANAGADVGCGIELHRRAPQLQLLEEG